LIKNGGNGKDKMDRGRVKGTGKKNVEEKRGDIGQA
jgi:hypothetical protein